MPRNTASIRLSHEALQTLRLFAKTQACSPSAAILKLFDSISESRKVRLKADHNPHILEELRGFYLRGEKGTRYAGKERKDILYLLSYIEALEARVEAAGLGVRHD